MRTEVEIKALMGKLEWRSLDAQGRGEDGLWEGTLATLLHWVLDDGELEGRQKRLGEKVVARQLREILGEIEPCPTCQGIGSCPTCRGSGRIEEVKE